MLSRFRIFIYLLAIVLLIGAIVLIPYIHNKPSVLPPDVLPIPEENATPTEGDDGSKLEQPEGGGSVGIKYFNEVTISLSDRTASLLISNPLRSNESIVLDVVIQNKVVIRSGALLPGNEVKILPLLNYVKLSSGHYEGRIRLYFYDIDTKYRSNLYMEIPVLIIVP